MEGAEAMAAALGWSSLSADLVNRVADCLLATNDLDYYMDLRGVCQHWRSSTADPRSNPYDPRFRPTRWILDETKLFFKRIDDTRLFVNTTTGRFLRKSLPLLHDRYRLVTSTVGGFLVLAEREPPHAALVLNPFTGSMIRFKAPVPDELSMTADVVVVAGDLLVLVLLPGYSSAAGEDGFCFFVADPGSEQFHIIETSSSSSSDASEMLDPLRSSCVLLRRGLAVELAPGVQVRVETSPQQGQGVRVFRMDAAGRAMEDEDCERIAGIGRRALFVGRCRCFSVDADSFPSINANCVYYYKAGAVRCKRTAFTYDLACDKEERMEQTCEYNYDDEGEVIPYYSLYPSPIVELLMHYTIYPQNLTDQVALYTTLFTATAKESL